MGVFLIFKTETEPPPLQPYSYPKEWEKSKWRMSSFLLENDPETTHTISVPFLIVKTELHGLTDAEKYSLHRCWEIFSPSAGQPCVQLKPKGSIAKSW